MYINLLHITPKVKADDIFNTTTNYIKAMPQLKQ